MNGKAAKMIRRFRGGTKEKRQWNTFPHTLRGRIRSEFNNNVKLIDIRPHSWPK